ncbi:extracellular matrix FRAS1, partial [Brachionus plicatilis]
IVLGTYDKTDSLVGFNQSSLAINETSKIVNVPIIRSGDFSKSFSLICSTKQQTATEDHDYVGRDSFEQSRVYFQPGEKEKMCSVEVINDDVFEADETFQIKLSDLRGPAEVKLSSMTTMTVTILNDEDSCVISLSEEVYYTEEPSTSDSSVVKSVPILRSGDLTRTSYVRAGTSDGTARAGLDYKPKTEVLKFAPGVSVLDFEVEILHDYEREGHESFRVILGPQDPVSGIFGKIKTATVVIKDSV